MSRTTRLGLGGEITLEKILSGESKSPAGIYQFEKLLANKYRIEEYLGFMKWLLEYAALFDQLSDEEKSQVECRVWTNQDRAKDMKYFQDKRKFDEERTMKALSPSALSRSKASSPRPSRRPQQQGTLLDICPFLSHEGNSATDPYESGGGLLQAAAPMASIPVNIPSLTRELRRGIDLYIKPAMGTRWELNLGHSNRYSITQAALRSIHPKIFAPAIEESETQLRTPLADFRESVCVNLSDARRVVSYYFAGSLFLAGALFALLATLSRLHPGLRFFVVLPWALAFCTAFCAYHGTCLLLFARGKTQLKAWDPDSQGRAADVEMMGMGRRIFEDWQGRYDREPFWKKVAGVEGAVEDPVVYGNQARLVLQGATLCLVVSVLAALGVFFIPAAKLF